MPQHCSCVFPKERNSERQTPINSRSLVLELTLMLRRGYIFQKSYCISAMTPHFAQLFGKKPPYGSFAEHVLRCWCSLPGVQ